MNAYISDYRRFKRREMDAKMAEKEQARDEEQMRLFGQLAAVPPTPMSKRERNRKKTRRVQVKQSRRANRR